MMPARAVAGGLHVEAVIDTVDDDLCLALWLHIAAHDTKGNPRLPVAGRKSWNDRLKGPLARRIDIGMPVGERKQLAAVLEHKAEPVCDQTRPHAAEVG